MKKLCLWLLLLIPGLAIGGQPTHQGYNVDVDPGIQVVDYPDGSALVNGNFKLFNDRAPSDALFPADFTVKIDGNVVQATIVRPPKSKAMADVIFCVDISGSMGSSIQAVKNNTEAFVNKLTSQSFDVRLGLITFGQRSKPYLRQRNGGQFYPTPQDFINEVGSLQASGWNEEWFDCLVHASQYPYRFGAERITILITDEKGNNGKYNINTAMPVVVNNASKVYGVSSQSLGNVVKAVTDTNGTLYNITDPFDKILDHIANSIINTYSVSLVTNVGYGTHYLHVTPSSNNPGGEDKEPFKIGANPVVSLSQATKDLIKNGFILGATTVDIAATVTDPDGGTIQAVNISWTEEPVGTIGNNAMNAAGGDSYGYTHTATSAFTANDCFAFFVQAIDNEGRNTTVPANLGNSPGGKWRIYMEKIPAVNAGDKVCYSVQASNPSSTAPLKSPEICFEVLQPAAPLLITPASAVMVIDDSPIEFIAAGGYGTYGWNTLNGDLSTTLADKTVYTPTLSGLDKLSVKDLKGFAATVVINVLPALTISPAIDGKRFSPSSV